MGGAGQTWRRRERTGADFRSTAVGPEGRRAARRVAYLERPPKCLPRFQLNLRPRGQQKRRKSSFVRMGTLLRLPAPVCGQIGRRAGAKKSPPARPEHEVAAPTYRNDVPLRLVKQLHGDPDALRDRHGSSPGVTLAPFLGCGVAAVRSRLPARRLGQSFGSNFSERIFRRFGCFHGRLIAHLGHEQRGERKKRSRSRRAKGKPDGTGRVSSWAEAEGRPDETRD